MLQVLASSWALLLGIGLLMVGNGLQSTLMGVRGALEGFSTFELSIVTSAYFAGFLGGSWLTPGLIRRVGHVRVFAALASFVSAAVILFPVVTDPWASTRSTTTPWSLPPSATWGSWSHQTSCSATRR
jgi:MFS family permease